MPSLGTSVASIYDPWAIQSRVGLVDARLALDSVLMPRPDLSWIDYRSGVMASGDTGGIGGSGHMAMKVQPDSGLAVTVQIGNAVVNTPGLGAYMCALDSQKTLSLAAASSTTNRIDLIIARVYDDLNSAIASGPGIRKFTVEVWTGDPSTGVPTRPTPTPTSGWTPLAAVEVPKSATEITPADITDLRGPGLVARGGMRGLYGADADPSSDAFAEPGAYPGDQRWVHSNGFQHQVYYGDNGNELQSGWRGVHNVLYYEQEVSTSNRIVGVGSHLEIDRVHIPYPGTPFRVRPTARASFEMAYYMDLDVRLSINDKAGGFINWATVTSKGVATNAVATRIGVVTPWAYGIFSGDVDVVFSVSIRDAPTGDYGAVWRPEGVLGKIQVEVLPAPAHPPTS